LARTVRDQNLETRSARSRLKPSPKPYYRTIDPGLHLGYRKGKSGGRWVVRCYVGDQDYKTETVANADDVADADGVSILNFAQAQGLAREMRARAARIAAGMPIDVGPYTVKQCVAEYLAWMEQNRKSAKDARYGPRGLSSQSSGRSNAKRSEPTISAAGYRRSRLLQRAFGGRRATVPASAQPMIKMRTLFGDGERQRTACLQF
jgi:hypothetical protein